MSVCACAGTNITWKHYVLFAVRYQEKEGLAWPLTPWSLTLLNRVLLLDLQTVQVTYFCMKRTLHWLLAGWKNCFHISVHSHWLALKTRQGIPVVERGQLFHHFVLKITVWNHSLSVDITFGVPKQNQKTEHQWQTTALEPDSSSHAPCSAQLYHQFQ